MINIKIEKCPIPTIWLDTSIIIKIAMWKSGLKLNESDSKKIPELYLRLYKLIEKRKVICPLSDQQEEIWKGEEICHEIAIQLSIGIHFKHKYNIKNSQLITFMRAYIKEFELIKLDYLNFFEENPIEEIERLKHENFIVSVLPIKYQEIEVIISNRKKPKDQLNEIKKNINENCISFEDQLQKEYKGTIEAYSIVLQSALNKNIRGIPLTITEYEGLKDLYRLISIWDNLGGKPSGPKGVLEFLKSDYQKSIPIINIQCKLGALLLTDNSKLENGDSMDLSHISMVLPFSTAILVDRKMRNRIQRLELDKIYSTKILSLNNFDEIIKFLNTVK